MPSFFHYILFVYLYSAQPLDSKQFSPSVALSSTIDLRLHHDLRHRALTIGNLKKKMETAMSHIHYPADRLSQSQTQTQTLRTTMAQSQHQMASFPSPHLPLFAACVVFLSATYRKVARARLAWKSTEPSVIRSAVHFTAKQNLLSRVCVWLLFLLVWSSLGDVLIPHTIARTSRWFPVPIADLQSQVC
jgi:hypothetical protein